MPARTPRERRVGDLSAAGLFLIVAAAAAFGVGIMLALDAALASFLAISVGAASLTWSPMVLVGVGVAGASSIPAAIGSLVIIH